MDRNEKITPEYLFLNRRLFLKNSLLVASLASLPLELLAKLNFSNLKKNEKYKGLFPFESITREEIATSYNNFYEFSLEKEDVQKKVEGWKLPEVWKVEIAGLTEKPQTLSLDDLVALAGGTMEERVYRFRCVEAWSMIVPWTGFPLEALISKLKPKKTAKYVKFVSFNDKSAAPNLSNNSYPWPYTEGLTMEEAMNPMTFIATGMYGKALPKQNGAPVRLVVPWKYGFKSIKSIVKIEFTDKQPKTLWNESAPNEYGFYANVNPDVPHPRWSQARERVLDKGFLPKKKPTLMFNGYEKEVAHLYKDLDLKKFY